MGSWKHSLFLFGFLQSGSGRKLLATFILKCGLLATFSGQVTFLTILNLTEKCVLATFFDQLAIFILKVGRLKPLGPKGLRVLWPLSHFFSYKIIIFKINKYIKCGEKSGHLTSK